jgi:hypothetical protein
MIEVTSSSPDFWLLATAALFENNNPQSGYQGAADVAQAIYNRVSLPGWPKSIRDVILQKGQFQPVRDYGGYSVWSTIKDKESALAFIKRFGHSQDALEGVAAAILDTTRQNSARTFVGSRDNFRSVAYEQANNHLEDSTEQRRFGHVFGFEHRGLNIAAFKAGQLSPAQINTAITGSVSYAESYTGATGRYKPASPGYFNAIEYITGDRTYRASNFDLKGHGMPHNYHDHIAFKTVQDKERAKNALRTANIVIGSENDGVHAKDSYHYKNLAIDIPGGQWGGSANDPIDHRQYAGSAKVRRVLGIDGSFTPRATATADLTSPITSSPSVSSRPAFNPANLKPLETHSPTVSVLSSFPVYENGKKAVYTRKRVNNNDVYTRNGKIISEDEFWRASEKKNSISSNQMGENGTTLSIASSPQYERLRGNVDIARTNYTDTTTNTKIYLIPVTA